MTDLIVREELRASLEVRLKDSSVLLVGAQRVGKSSLLQDFSETNPPGAIVHVIDLQGRSTLASFVNAVGERVAPRGALSGLQSTAAASRT